jgi:hypothetical protein
MKKRHRDRHLAAGRRGEPKEVTRGECGSRRKLAAACFKLSRRAALARRKGNMFGKFRTWGNWGSRSKLAAAGIRMTHSTQVARHREHGLQRQGKKPIHVTKIFPLSLTLSGRSDTCRGSVSIPLFMLGEEGKLFSIYAS